MQKINLSDFGFRQLQIETKAACNMACSFCPYPLKEDKKSKLAFDEIKKIINQIDPNDKEFKYITFSQFNEPLLDNRIFEIIEYAQSCGFKVLMITNGLLLNKEKNIEGILRLKPDVKISLQVLDKTTHKDARGLNLDLEKYVQTIVDFCKKAKNQPINITIDIGSNYNDKKYSFYLKKLLGIQTGDPSIPKDTFSTINDLKRYLKYFYDISDTEYKKSFLPFFENNKVNEIFNKDYFFQKGFNMFNNIIIKIKLFHYGRKIKDFKPRNNNFSCGTEILAVQADGHVAPCCLAYDDSISLGKVFDSSLEKILEDNQFLKNLRDVNGKKHITCRKCYGEPTTRGVFFRNLYDFLPKNFKDSKFINFLK